VRQSAAAVVVRAGVQVVAAAHVAADQVRIQAPIATTTRIVVLIADHHRNAAVMTRARNKWHSLRRMVHSHRHVMNDPHKAARHIKEDAVHHVAMANSKATVRARVKARALRVPHLRANRKAVTMVGMADVMTVAVVNNARLNSINRV
jgi:hypothetical protein